MKIAIGTKIKDGPWGGGNLFAKNLSNYLKRKNHKVYFDLSHDNLDIILLTEPRKTSESSAFTQHDIENYLKYVKKDCLVVHRINECDERKQTNHVNKYIIYANQISDHTVFVSKWIQDLYISQGIKSNYFDVIMAGADKEIFNSNNFKPWNGNEKLKIVTHHWGANWNKGFDIYEYIDQLLDEVKYRNLFEFTYIGNLPKNFSFKNSKVIKPQSGEVLSNSIKNNHLYITASISEPSGNHHIEAAQCGLPIMFVKSGGVPEYCDGFGLSFNKQNFTDKLDEIIKNYKTYQNNMKKYPYNSEIMSEEFEKLFETMISKKEDYLKIRKKYKSSFLDEKIYKLRRKKI